MTRRRRSPVPPAEPTRGVPAVPDRFERASRDYVEGLFCEVLDGLHAAVAGDLLTLRRILARTADVELFAYVLALQAGHALNLSGQSGPLLLDLAEHIDDPDHHHRKERP